MFKMPPASQKASRHLNGLADRLLKSVMMRNTISKNSSARASAWQAILIFVAVLGAALGPAARAAQSVTLAWNASTGSGVAGYMVLSGSDGINYSNQINAGTNTIWTVTGLQEGTTNYFEVTAYDTNNNQSPPSSPVEYVVPNTTNTVAVQASPASAGSVTGGGSFATGSSVTVMATANSGYTFANWTLSGAVQSTSPSYTFTLAADCNLVANFTTNPTTNTVAVQASPASAGSVTGGGSFATGSSVTVKATANSGYTFTKWTQNGTVQSTSSSYSFTLATNLTMVANFAATSSTNTVTADPAEAGSVTGGGSFATGSSVTVTATANSGYAFIGWTQNGIKQSISPSYTFTQTTNRALVANFTMTLSTNTGAVQLSVVHGPPQVVTVGFSVAPGTTYSVQASTDLKNWETIWQTTATTNTWVQFQDPAAGNPQSRFYRTVSN